VNRIGPSLEDFDRRNEFSLSTMADLERRKLAKVVYPHKALCDAWACRVEEGGHALYADDNHLTRYGAALIKDVFKPAF
jgi:hypothetical protein